MRQKPKWAHLLTEERVAHFWARIDKSGECWTWKLTPTRGGYGRLGIWQDGRNVAHVLAHRISFYLHHGYLTEGLVIDHLCRNRLCVRPEHLEEVAPVENTRRGAASRTHCSKGHAFDGQNTYRHPTRGTRHCRACQLEINRRIYRSAA